MAQTASRKYLRELPSSEELRRTVQDLKPLGDTRIALFGAAYLEVALKALLLEKFVSLGKEEDKRLFDGSAGGILGSFNAKVRLAHAMGFYNDTLLHDLLLINDIRNVFAHSLHTIYFSTTEVAEDCARLKTPKSLVLKNAHGSEHQVTEPMHLYSVTFQFLYHAIRYIKGDRDMFLTETKSSDLSLLEK